jgi:hypothetical protein
MSRAAQRLPARPNWRFRLSSKSLLDRGALLQAGAEFIRQATRLAAVAT